MVVEIFLAGNSARGFLKVSEFRFKAPSMLLNAAGFRLGGSSVLGSLHLRENSYRRTIQICANPHSKTLNMYLRPRLGHKDALQTSPLG